jgi:hypothetical protein
MKNPLFHRRARGARGENLKKLGVLGGIREGFFSSLLEAILFS